MSSNNPADHHSRILLGLDDQYELTEYTQGESIGIVTDFDTKQDAREYFNSHDYDHPLVDLCNINLDVPLPIIEEKEQSRVATYNDEAITTGDAIVEIVDREIKSISIVLEPTEAGVATYRVKGPGKGEYGWVPSTHLYEDVNAKTDTAKIIVEDAYEKLIESATTIPQRATTPQETAKHIEDAVDVIKENRGDDPEAVAHALDDLSVYANNLTDMFNSETAEENNQPAKTQH